MKLKNEFKGSKILIVFVISVFFLDSKIYSQFFGTFEPASTIGKKYFALKAYAMVSTDYKKTASVTGIGIGGTFGLKDNLDVSLRIISPYFDSFGGSVKWCFLKNNIINLGIGSSIYYDILYANGFVYSGTLFISNEKHKCFYPYGSFQLVHFSFPSSEPNVIRDDPANLGTISVGIKLWRFFCIEFCVPVVVYPYIENAGHPISIGGSIENSKIIK
ncbi:MAG: hypothetical protein WC614_13555 [bacterium]